MLRLSECPLIFYGFPSSKIFILITDLQLYFNRLLSVTSIFIDKWKSGYFRMYIMSQNAPPTHFRSQI